MGDHQCRRPRLCEQGRCVEPGGSADELQAAGEARVNGGKWTMVAGAVALGLGIILLPIGLVRVDEGSPEEQAGECGNIGQPSCEDYGLGSFVAGAALTTFGGLVLLAGGIAFGVGKKKLRLAEQKSANAWRVQPRFTAGRSGATVGLVGRF